MARKPIHLEMKGGKTPRQRIWEAVRANRKRFTQAEIAEVVGGLEENIDKYFRGLVAAQFIEVIAEERVGRFSVRKTYRLVRDNGVEAPRVTRAGAQVVHGAITEAMWGTMHRMFERKDFNCRELAAFASTANRTVTKCMAERYIAALHAAGYLNRTQEAVLGMKGQPARYVMKASKYTGPRAPIMQHARTIYDPNQGRIVWVDQKGIEDAN